MVKSKNTRIQLFLIVGIPLVVSTLSGFNQLFGFFSNISIYTAVLSGLLAIFAVALFPKLLKANWPEGDTLPKLSTLKLASILIGVVILGFGVGPFLIKWQAASQDKISGVELMDFHQYGLAQARLSKAFRYFDDLGLRKQAIDARLDLIQSYVGIGDFSVAEEMIDELEQSGLLEDHQSGLIHAIQGGIAYERGEFETAEHEYQLARQAVLPETSGYASLMQNQAVLWSGKGVSYKDRVQENFDVAKDIYEELGDEVGRAYILINEGALLENDPDSARALFEEAKAIVEKVQNSYLLGVISFNLGYTSRQKGDLAEAEEYYYEARIKFEEAADLEGQADVELNLAALEQVQGNIELARQHLNSSEAYLRSLEQDNEKIPPRRKAQILTFQADIYDMFGESETSRILYEEALSIYASNPDPLSEASTLVNYAGLLARLNQGEEGRELLERAREIVQGFADEGPFALIVVMQNNLGRTYQDIGDNEMALFYYEQSRDGALALGEEFYYAQAVENIGNIYSFTGNIFEALENYEEALSIYRVYENRDREVQTLYNVISIYSAFGDPTVPEMVSELLSMLQEYNIDREVESGVLFGVLIQDITEMSDLIAYRERLNQLRRFYENLDEPIGLGRSHQKLANVEQYLGNLDEMVRHAREAEKYVEEIPLPLRISVHTDLGFFILNDSPEDGLAHFQKAFDLAGNYDISQQRSLAVVINLNTIIYASDLDCRSHLDKAIIVVENTGDDEIRNYFQEIIDVLNPICN